MRFTVVVCPEHNEMILSSEEDKSVFSSSGCCPRCGKIPKQVRSIEREIKETKKKKVDIEFE